MCLHSTHSNRQFLPLVRDNDSFVQVEKCNNLADDSEVFQRDLWTFGTNWTIFRFCQTGANLNRSENLCKLLKKMVAKGVCTLLAFMRDYASWC